MVKHLWKLNKTFYIKSVQKNLKCYVNQPAPVYLQKCIVYNFNSSFIILCKIIGKQYKVTVKM